MGAWIIGPPAPPASHMMACSFTSSPNQARALQAQPDLLSGKNCVIVVEDSSATEARVIGVCKWFSDNLGYGFITVCDGEDAGADVFVHYSGIRPLNNSHKTLRKGEYVSFRLSQRRTGLQAVHVMGVLGGPLMCDHVIRSRLPTTVPVSRAACETAARSCPAPGI